LQTTAQSQTSFLQITSRAICGSPSDVLIQLKLAEQPVSQRWLVERTGYCTKTIRTALRRLLDFGLVECIGRCAWQLTHKALQFWLGLLDHSTPPTVDLPPSDAHPQIEIAAAHGAHSGVDPAPCPAPDPCAAPNHETQQESDSEWTASETTYQDAPDEETQDALACWRRSSRAPAPPTSAAPC
jgi:hypothetical protein